MSTGKRNMEEHPLRDRLLAVKRRIRLEFQSVVMGLIEWVLEHIIKVPGPCFHFGGVMRDPYGSVYKIRLCFKDRWHTDSHFFEICDPDAYLVERVQWKQSYEAARARGWVQ